MLDDLLKLVYPDEDLKKINLQIEALKEKYDDLHQGKINTLSEKDIVLITYGDQVKKEGESRAVTLHHFLNDTAKNVINSIHILPFYPYTSDDGFSIVDYTAVNPAIGNWDDIQKLSEDYHLMFDAVINHISQESDWFKGYLAGDEQYKDYFIDADPNADWTNVVRPRTSPLLHTFKGADGIDKNIWTTFSKDQVDLNYSNPNVFIHVLDVLLFYVSQGAKMIRLDAIGFLFKQPGTECIHLEQTHALIKIMRLVIEDLAPEISLISETNVPHKENVSYFGNGEDEAHMVYNFTLPPLLAYSVLSGKTQDLTDWASSLKLPSNKACFFNFTASHDGIGVRPLTGILPDAEIAVLTESAEKNGGLISYRTTEGGGKSPYEINCNYLSLLHGPEKNQEIALKRMKLVQAAMLVMPGVPSFYFHTLYGSLNYEEGVKETGMNRTINREKLEVEALTNELNNEDSLRHRLFSVLKELIQCRMNQKAFNPYAPFEIVTLPDGLFGIKRHASSQEQSLLCLFNFKNEQIEFELPVGNYSDLLSNEFLSGNITFEPYDFYWLECK